jgi:tetratricopeptide (TPR) repeat protein
MKDKEKDSLRKVIFPLITGAIILLSGSAAGNVCPEAKKYLQNESFVEAEKEAQNCMEKDPENVQIWIILARAFAGQQKFIRALNLVEKAMQRYPDDTDIAALRIKILAWLGDYEAAWNGIFLLKTEAFNDKDTVRLAADIALWKGENEKAIMFYNRFLEKWSDDPQALRNRAIAYELAGYKEESDSDYRKLCKIQGSESEKCKKIREEDTFKHFSIFLEPHYMLVENKPNDWNMFGEFKYRVKKPLEFGANLDYRSRNYTGANLVDAYSEFFGTWFSESGFVFHGAAGYTFHRRFSPIWSAQIEPGYITESGFEFYLKYWYVRFPDNGVSIISPSVSHTYHSWVFYLRYYLSFKNRTVESGKENLDVGHSVVGKITYYLLDPFLVYAGGGIGNTSDYLEVRDVSSDKFWLLQAGAGWQITDHHRITIDYAYLNESSGSSKFIQHEFYGGYQLPF